MTTKNEQLKKLIEAIVRKEVRAIVPQVVKEVMAGMIMESNVGPVVNNSDKRVRLSEHNTAAEPMYGNGPMVGWDEEEGPPSFGGTPVYGAGRSMGMNTLDHAMSEGGNPIPIDPRMVPEAVLRAMNTDYRGFMKKLDSKKNGGV